MSPAFRNPSNKREMDTNKGEMDDRCEFHHVQIYVKRLKSLEVYKRLEDLSNELASRGRFDPFSGGMRFLQTKGELPRRIEEGKKIWKDIGGGSEDKDGEYDPNGQDLVEQFILGLGWRITAEYTGAETHSFLITSMDSLGVKMVVTAPRVTIQDGSGSGAGSGKDEFYAHFGKAKTEQFFDAHGSREGIGVLGFEVFDGRIEQVFRNYQRLHPKLLVDGHVHEYEDVRMKKEGQSDISTRMKLGSIKVLEVYAYYLPTAEAQSEREPDCGTILRFVERYGSYGRQPGFGNPEGVLPGLTTVQYTFDGTSIPAYSDHWVSNVVDRESFLATLNDTLGFTPKVDFNAGVVAAGEAKIESTVTGNSTQPIPKGKSLRDQSQVYLPINNALSSVGHVSGFLDELGQGVQHLASRVDDLVAFIERVNNYREICNGGFSFLNIPRSYFGYLDPRKDFMAIQVDEEVALKVFNVLQEEGLVSVTGVVDLDITKERVEEALDKVVSPASTKVELDVELRSKIADIVLRARYSNIYKLLRENIDERTYIEIVRNKILVDIQGNDILYQIFTSNILKHKPTDEAPFLEFIQRVCADGDKSTAIKPGCGGFGIRNFLTLFLSIEVSKAMNELERATDERAERYANERICLFTQQLDVSNPVLTQISDAMTAEADAIEKLANDSQLSPSDRQSLLETAKSMASEKLKGNEKLQEISSEFAQRFSKLKQEFEKTQ